MRVFSTLLLCALACSPARAGLFVHTVTHFAETEAAIHSVDGSITDRDSGSLNGFGFLTTESIAGGPAGVQIQAREHFDNSMTRANSVTDTLYFRGTHSTDVRTTTSGFTNATDSGVFAPTGAAGFGGGEVTFTAHTTQDWTLTGTLESFGIFDSTISQSSGVLNLSLRDHLGVPIHEFIVDSPNGIDSITLNLTGTVAPGDYSILLNSHVGLSTPVGSAPSSFGSTAWDFQWGFTNTAVPEPSSALMVMMLSVPIIRQRRRRDAK